MSALRTRLTSLEAAMNPSGPLLVCWRVDPERRATCAYDDVTYIQRDDEVREQFFRRVAAAVPARLVVWVDQLDERL